jgi:hypothetical protein
MERFKTALLIIITGIAIAIIYICTIAKVYA